MKELKIKYKNWQGKIGIRTIKPIKIWHGKTKWHPKTQWFIPKILWFVYYK